ncbi:MAG: VTT domain-containing protein [Cyanobacteria bacterium J06650_10]
MSKRSRQILGFITLIFIVAIPIIVLSQLGIGKAEIKAFVEQLGVWAPVGLFFLRFTSVVIPALPGTAYSVLAGGLLGFGQGMVVVCLSDLCSCSLSFFLASQFGRSFVKRLVGDRFMAKVDQFSQRNLENNFFLLSALMMTSFFDFVAYGAGLARTPWQKFLPALVISILVSNPPFIALGAGIFDEGVGPVSSGKAVAWIALSGIFGLSLITGLVRRKSSTAGIE